MVNRDGTCSLNSAKCVHLPYLRHISPITKMYRLLQTDYCMYFYLIVLFPLTARLQLINFTAS